MALTSAFSVTVMTSPSGAGPQVVVVTRARGTRSALHPCTIHPYRAALLPCLNAPGPPGPMSRASHRAADHTI